MEQNFASLHSFTLGSFTELSRIHSHERPHTHCPGLDRKSHGSHPPHLPFASPPSVCTGSLIAALKRRTSGQADQVAYKTPHSGTRSIFEQLNFILFGVYIWEYALSWQLESALICRRIPPRWPLLPYITGRIFLLTSMIIICCWLSSPSQLADCHSTFSVFTFTANAAIGCSSLNLMLRPFMIWKTWRYIRIFLVIVTVGHWVFLLRVLFGFTVMNVNGNCGFMVVDHTKMTTLFVYTMCYDMLALALTIIGLRNTPSSNMIRRTLHIQGIAYVLVTCLANIVPTVMSSLNLNIVMNVAFAMPASTVSTIASSRIVASFLDLHSSGPAQEMGSRDIPLTTMVTLPTESSIGSHYRV